MTQVARWITILVSSVALTWAGATGSQANEADSRMTQVVDASEFAASQGVDVISIETSNRTNASYGNIQAPPGMGVRRHIVVSADASYYESIRVSRNKRLLGSRGYNPNQGYWATPSMMYRDARSDALVAAGLLTATTSITGLDEQWPYRTFTPESASDDGTNYPWYMVRTSVLPYNVAWGHVPISGYREQRGRGGTRIITGRVDAGTEPESDPCSVSRLRIVVDAEDRIRESTWTRKCSQRGAPTTTIRYRSTTSYGLQDPKPATSPSITRDALPTVD